MGKAFPSNLQIYLSLRTVAVTGSDLYILIGKLKPSPVRTEYNVSDNTLP
jgi:hypothetical protein